MSQGGHLCLLVSAQQDAGLPTSLSLFTAYVVFLMTARYTQPKPPSPMRRSSEKSRVPWVISQRGQQKGLGWGP